MFSKCLPAMSLWFPVVIDHDVDTVSLLWAYLFAIIYIIIHRLLFIYFNDFKLIIYQKHCPQYWVTHYELHKIK